MMQFDRPSLATIALASTLLFGGCIYRLPIQQGNFLEDKELNQIQLGMTRTQVRYLLGTPMVADPFQTSRWDYVFTFTQGNVNRANRRHFIVHFENDKVVRIERPDAAS